GRRRGGGEWVGGGRGVVGVVGGGGGVEENAERVGQRRRDDRGEAVRVDVLEEPIGEVGALVRPPDRRHRREEVGPRRQHVARVEPALAVADEVHLAGAARRRDGLDLREELLAALLARRERADGR